MIVVPVSADSGPFQCVLYEWPGSSERRGERAGAPVLEQEQQAAAIQVDGGGESPGQRLLPEL